MQPVLKYKTATIGAEGTQNAWNEHQAAAEHMYDEKKQDLAKAMADENVCTATFDIHFHLIFVAGRFSTSAKSTPSISAGH